MGSGSTMRGDRSTMGNASMGNTSMGMSNESAMGSGSTMTGDRSTMGNTSMEMGTESTMEARSTTASDSVIGVAASNDSFKILTAALRASGLDQVLAAEGPYTIFAPTDAAFAALPAGTIEQLLRPENRDLLVQVLSYHVVPGEMSSTMLESGATETVQGSPVEVVVSDTGVMVNNARVVQADIEASNGVIHAIDQVILPPDA
ncbi:MAG: fasciclin domain-containing protein [Kastovskya adunca ATA6-11-RM4]|nr:fasciclin domain-containing protein [Kastovskya adunca ATA6-11-RM4]